MENRENIRTRRIMSNVKGKIIEFDEYYVVDPNTGEEVFDRDVEIENDSRLYDIYKKQMNLLTASEIKNIRKKYNMNQKEFALSIGMGEVSINRFENGSIQTESVDAVIRLSENPDNMYDLLIKNQSSLPEDEYINFLRKVDSLKTLKRHHIADFNLNDFLNLEFKSEAVDDVADQIIVEYNSQIDNLSKEYDIDDNYGEAEYITPLKLQKLLYYVQGLSLRIYDEVAFSNSISAWKFGPVVEEIYYQYKAKGKNPISTPNTKKEINPGLKKIIELVVSSYGKIEAGSLIDLTHEEDPWTNTDISDIISVESIKEYFNKIYE